ncbi:MAG: methyl-accepting chemotaxis protein [Gammaproteobacteria bacterium]|nr:methyl-accepting chemotaxis protein [Gammaproteobacteria bacterium]
MKLDIKLHLITTAAIGAGFFLGNYASTLLSDTNSIINVVTQIGFSVVLVSLALVLYFNKQQNALLQATKHLEEIARGDKGIDHKLPENTHPSLKALATNYNKTVDKISSSINAFKNSTNELAFTASKMSDITERTENNIKQQKSETDQVATAMSEMSSTVEEVARNATDASQAAEQANQAATNGVNIASKTQTDISSLVSDVKHASEVISHLAEESENIGVVLDVIKGIAEQTNLLALNAAIEAARAGEQGRGFAVVADEVRTLASKTQTSTSEIEEMISRLQAGVSNAVTVMQTSLDKGQQGSQQVENTLEALNKIMESVGLINDMNAQIATAAEEQSAVANEINSNICAISQATDKTTYDAHESRQTAEKLAGISMNIGRQIKDFDVTSASSGLDLSSAKAAHLNWKTRIRSFLDGKESLSPEQAVSHKHCDFGKWYYSQGLKNFGDIQAIVDVEKPHEELHKTIKEIIDMKNSGDVKGSEEAYEKISYISGEIVRLLDKAEVQANSK